MQRVQQHTARAVHLHFSIQDHPNGLAEIVGRIDGFTRGKQPFLALIHQFPPQFFLQTLEKKTPAENFLFFCSQLHGKPPETVSYETDRVYPTRRWVSIEK